MRSLQGATAIIGGVDGPTAITVATGDFKLDSCLLSLPPLP